MSASTPNRISVALCTYNGERFLPQQLASIAKQTRPPDELVVCDDRSTDRTVALLQEFAASSPYPVKIFENEHNLGYAANFERAIRLCAGNLIALSDQDDIWYPIRLERSEKEFAAHPQAGLVFSDADVINDSNELAGPTLWQRLGFAGKRAQDLLAGHYVVLAKHRFVTGATVMFRADLRDRLLPIGDGWIHDEWIALIAAAFSDLRPIDQPLIRYRIHDSQEVGFRNKLEQRVQGNSRAQRHWGRLAESVKELRQLSDALSAMVPDKKRPVLSAYQEHLQFLSFRASLPAPRLARLGRILGKYSQYEVHASGLASALKDLVLKRER
ncbi:MAG: glycosyltransferase family 2 protein [Acidobacteriaceae bacterium]|jgi:glycosyltransferase involved in cell wall biosynthesis